ncbi:MFS transporter [Ferrovibrio sp.]|uniref:MFS transporter n=1 Tax=Ferrovibrio sp. TaxID=1917215 RepID=UPI003D2AB9C1
MTHDSKSAFNRLWFANLAAHGADQLSLAALPLLAVLSLGASPEEMGALGAAQTLPYLLLSLLAGFWADRFPRHWLMAGAEAGRALLLLLLPLVAVTGWLGLGSLGLLGFLLAAASVVFNVAAQAYLPALVAREGLAAANARLEFARAAAVFLGPGAAGLVASWASPAIALGVSAFASAYAAWLLRAPEMRRPVPPQPRQDQKQSLAPALAEGFRIVWLEPLLRAIAGCAMAWNFSWFLLMAVFVLFATQRLGISPTGIGIVLGVQGVGMLLASVTLPLYQARLPLGLMIAVGPSLSALAAVLVASASLAEGSVAMLLLSAGFFTFGYGPMLWTIGQTSLRQALVPARLIGRVSAIQQVATLGMRPIGALAGGLVGGAYGLEAAMWLAACGFGVQLAVILLSPVPRLQALPEATV